MRMMLQKRGARKDERKANERTSFARQWLVLIKSPLCPANDTHVWGMARVSCCVSACECDVRACVHPCACVRVCVCVRALCVCVCVCVCVWFWSNGLCVWVGVRLGGCT